MTVTRGEAEAADRPMRGGVSPGSILQTGEMHPGTALPVTDWVAEELRALIARLTLRLDDVERFLPPLAAAAEVDGRFEDASSAPLDADPYADLADWVQGYFASVYSRPLGGQWRWCPRWSEHPEAAERLDALWKTWQAAQRQPPMAMATWLRDHLDHHLPVLLGPAGPFAGCSPVRHERHRALNDSP